MDYTTDYVIDLNEYEYEFCPLCKYQKDCHSFHKVLETEEYIYYYTCPSEAIHYDDTDGIISHLYNELEDCIKKEKKWIWLFNSYDFGLKHAAQISQSKRFIEFLYPRYTYLLENIIIIDKTNCFKILYNTIYYLIPKTLRETIIFNDSKKFNISIIRDQNVLYISI